MEFGWCISSLKKSGDTNGCAILGYYYFDGGDAAIIYTNEINGLLLFSVLFPIYGKEGL